MNGTRKIILAMTAMIVAVLLIQSLPSVSASSVDESFHIDLVDNEGNLVTEAFAGGSPLSFDTKSDQNGTKYTLKSSATIDTIPVNLRITAQSGEYKVNVTVTGVSSFLVDSGLRIIFGDDYVAELDSSNNFSSDVNNSGKNAVFEPNRMYPISLSTWHGVETDIEPETAGGMTFTFCASMSEGYHHVTFISRGEVVESRIMSDGETIELPSVKGRLIHEVKGWYTSDGKLISHGYELTEDDGDIVATAEWGLSITTLVTMGVGIACALYLIRIFRRGRL